jgi:glycosyltransferase involved in cell wall biosynthesis
LVSRTPPLVSVVIPFLNPVGLFLRQAVESVQAQTYSHWEIILVDDGSTSCEGVSAARELAGSMAGRVRLVTYTTPGHRGTAAARTEGIRQCAGTYVSFLDADDVWLPGKLSAEIQALESNAKLGMVYSAYKYWYGWQGAEHPARDWIPRLGVQTQRPIEPPTFVRLFVRGDAAVPTPSCTTFRRAALEAVGGGETSVPRVYEDQALFAKVAMRYPVLAIPELTTLYRQHAASVCAANVGEAERVARAGFLVWLRQRVRDSALADGDLVRVVEEEIWDVEHPRSARLRRWVRKLAAPHAS